MVQPLKFGNDNWFRPEYVVIYHSSTGDPVIQSTWIQLHGDNTIERISNAHVYTRDEVYLILCSFLIFCLIFRR